MNVQKKLREWQAQGLITPAQSTQIQDYESKTTKSWFSIGFLILGTCVLGIGIISLIAANWENITPATKLSLDFLILIGTACLIYYTWNNNKLVATNSLILFFIIFCLASIGLISQVYNLIGFTYQPLLFWALITAPIMFISKYMIVSLLWLLGLFSGLMFLSFESVIGYMIFKEQLPLVLLCLALLCANLFFINKSFIQHVSFSKSTRLMAVFLVVCTIFITDLMRDFVWDRSYAQAPEAYLLNFILLISAVITCQKARVYTQRQNNFLCITMFAVFIYANLPSLGIKADIAYAVGSLLLLAMGACIFASLHRRGLFNLLMVLLGLRFVILYFQAFGGLATTGVGLIIAGLIIIGFVILWIKYQAKIWNVVARLTQDE